MATMTIDKKMEYPEVMERLTNIAWNLKGALALEENVEALTIANQCVTLVMNSKHICLKCDRFQKGKCDTQDILNCKYFKAGE